MSREQSKRTISCPLKCIARRRDVAGIGTSPAVLMNTVWALECHGGLSYFNLMLPFDKD